MKVLFLHGWHSKPGGTKPTYLKDHGHELLNPVLPDDDSCMCRGQGRRRGRVQGQDLDLRRPTVSLEEMDAIVAGHFHAEAGKLSAHGRRAGLAKAVALELAAQFADLSNRVIGEHGGVSANAIGANRRPLAGRPQIVEVIKELGQQLRKRKPKRN